VKTQSNYGIKFQSINGFELMTVKLRYNISKLTDTGTVRIHSLVERLQNLYKITAYLRYSHDWRYVTLSFACPVNNDVFMDVQRMQYFIKSTQLDKRFERLLQYDQMIDEAEQDGWGLPQEDTAADYPRVIGKIEL
jgi:hypothetical protein